jgi:hypothetical protein
MSPGRPIASFDFLGICQLKDVVDMPKTKRLMLFLRKPARPTRARFWCS